MNRTLPSQRPSDKCLLSERASERASSARALACVRVGVVADECKNTLTHRPFYESHAAVVILPFSRLTPSRPSSSSEAAQRIVDTGDVLRLLLDSDAGTLTVKKNGTLLGVAVPSGLTGDLCWMVSCFRDSIGDSVRIKALDPTEF